MSILIYCKQCNQYLSRKKVENNKNNCFKCGDSLKRSQKFRIVVPTPEGRKITTVVEGTLTYARKVEAKYKTDVSKKKHFNVESAPRIDVIYGKYIAWAKKK